MKKEDMLDYVGYHHKWHGQSQKSRREYQYNQNDYLIQEIFERIGVKTGFFVEFGAWDGILGSNTRKLFESGWSGILIEPEKSRFASLQKNYENNSNVHTLNTTIETSGHNIFDNVVDEYVKEKTIDFCSIDIDGLDLEVFETIEKHFPNVICIEGGQMLNPLLEERIPVHLSMHNIQQSLKIMNESFEKRGYKLLCTYQDSFFIKEEYYKLFRVKDNLFDLYIDGILAYPRIPWIIETLSKVGLSNGVLNYIMSHLSHYDPRFSADEKSKWIDSNYHKISNAVEKLRKYYS